MYIDYIRFIMSFPLDQPRSFLAFIKVGRIRPADFSIPKIIIFCYNRRLLSI